MGRTADGLLVARVVEETGRSGVDPGVHPSGLKERLQRRLPRRVQHYAHAPSPSASTAGARTGQSGLRGVGDVPSSELRANRTPSKPASVSFVNMFGSLSGAHERLPGREM